MDYGTVLSILRRSNPDMTLDDAFALVESISNQAYSDAAKKHSEEREQSSKVIAEATLWGSRNLSDIDLRNRKIECIKILRAEFCDLDVRSAKGVVEVLELGRAVHLCPEFD